MRVLRSTLWSPALEPLTTVVRDSDVIDTLESVRAGGTMPGGFVSFDLFDMEDEDIVVATTAAIERINHDEERNMAILYYWATAHFQLVSEAGMVFMPEPAPLSAHQIRGVFEQIVEHPDYTQQGVRSMSQEGVEVYIEKGVVK